MASRILPEYGFDSSCGDFAVKVVEKQFESSSNSASIQVHYDQFVDSDHIFYGASFPWNGGEISVADAEALLKSAKVPVFIQFASAIGMLLKFVDQTLKQRREEEMSAGLPSIVVKISSDMETIECDSEFDYEEEEC